MELITDDGINNKESSNELSRLQETITQLQEELAKERSRRFAVEEECDLLAMVYEIGAYCTLSISLLIFFCIYLCIV